MPILKSFYFLFLILGPSLEEGYTFGVWLEMESILMGLPKVSEVATNH